MTENKRFTMHRNEFLTSFDDNGKKMTHQQIVNTLNSLNDELEECKHVNKRCNDAYMRRMESLDKIRRDFDKLWEICKDNGMTEDELIRELER